MVALRRKGWPAFATLAQGNGTTQLQSSPRIMGPRGQSAASRRDTTPADKPRAPVPQAQGSQDRDDPLITYQNCFPSRTPSSEGPHWSRVATALAPRPRCFCFVTASAGRCALGLILGSAHWLTRCHAFNFI